MALSYWLEKYYEALFVHKLKHRMLNCQRNIENCSKTETSTVVVMALVMMKLPVIDVKDTCGCYGVNY